MLGGLPKERWLRLSLCQNCENPPAAAPVAGHRQRLIGQQTRTKNRLRSLPQRHHLVPPEGDLFSETQRSWWNKLELTPSEKLCARRALIILGAIGELERFPIVNKLVGMPAWEQDNSSVNVSVLNNLQ